MTESWRRVMVAAVVALFAGLGLAAGGAGAVALPPTPSCLAKLPASYPAPPVPIVPGAFVPAGPVSVVVCRYRDGNDPSIGQAGRLAGRAVATDPATVMSLMSAFDALPPVAGRGDATSCPSDDGASIAVVFSYPGSPSDTVVVHPNGCAHATNGSVTVGVTTELTSALDQLTGCEGAFVCDADPLRPSARPAAAGYVQLCGGPPPGGCRVETLGLCNVARACVTTDRVVVLDSRRRVLARAPLHGARFRVRLPPAGGTYTLELFADGRGAPSRAMGSAQVRSVAGTTTAIAFVFSIP